MTRFSLRDKRLFEISEVEITRVDYTFYIESFPFRVDTISEGRQPI